MEQTQEELKQLQINDLGIDNLLEMYKLLNEAEGIEGILLRNVWNKYEDKLRVHDTNYSPASDLPKADKNASGEYGIFIHLDRDVVETEALNDYQQIFHEFFHSIDFIVGRSSTNKNDTFTWIYKSNAFAKIIKDEANDIKKKGDIVKIQQRSNLNDQKERAYLFDILGGVLNGDRIKWLDGVSTEFGHDKSYWGKDSAKLDGGDVYNALIASETFANMASSAITNINAFNLMKDKLPKSYNMFIDILKKMLLL